jgi:DNA polymerase V
VFDTKLELEHAGVAAGFPSPADEYRHETLDFNRDYIRHPEASFYGDVEGIRTFEKI